jgi:hypothetical protein
MRARPPDSDGYLDRGGVKLHHEVFGDGEPTLLLPPTWAVMAPYDDEAQGRSALAVLDATGSERAVLVSLSMEFFRARCFPEPHSTRIEDSVASGHETTPQVLIVGHRASEPDVKVNLLIREFVASLAAGEPR